MERTGMFSTGPPGLDQVRPQKPRQEHYQVEEKSAASEKEFRQLGQMAFHHLNRHRVHPLEAYHPFR